MKGVATLSIQKVTTSSATAIAVIRSMHLALDQIQKSDGDAKAVVLTGCGDVFCSGVDLHAVERESAETRQRVHVDRRRFMDPPISASQRRPLPDCRGVNGAAVGVGMSLALASDMIVAGENAYFLPSFARLGLVPDADITFHLARRIGGGRSLSSLMLAEKIDAKVALEWGLACAVVSQANVVSDAH